MTTSNTASRLPTLSEVVASKSASPVDLFGFYVFMRDEQRSVDYLDLWLDIKQHTSLCRVYVRELRRSVLVATPDLEKDVSERGRSHSPSSDERGSFEKGVAYERPPHAGGGHIGDHNISPFLRSTPAMGLAGDSAPLVRASVDTDIPRQRMINRSDLRSAAEKILYTYLLPGSEREVILPYEMVADIQNAIEKDQRDDPEVFDAAREYIFQAMEREAFPGFLRQKALGNLIRVTSLGRLILGLLALFGGLWAGFAMIFLGYSRATRCWVILPFTVGVYLLFTHQYNLDPIIALVGYSESTFMKFRHIDEVYGTSPSHPVFIHLFEFCGIGTNL